MTVKLGFCWVSKAEMYLQYPVNSKKPKSKLVFPIVQTLQENVLFFLFETFHSEMILLDQSLISFATSHTDYLDINKEVISFLNPMALIN